MKTPKQRLELKLRELYFNQRYTLPRAAEACGVSTKKAAAIIRQAGYQLRGRMGGNREDITPRRVAKLYGDGKTVNEIARLLGTTQGLIRGRLHKANAEMRPRRGANISTESLIDLCINQGLSTHKAADRVHLHPSAICRRLKKAGYMLPKGNRRVKTVLETMISDYFDLKLNLQEVAERAGVSLGTAKNRFKQAGIQIRTQAEGAKIARDRDREELRELREAANNLITFPRRTQLKPETKERIDLEGRLLAEGMRDGKSVSQRGISLILFPQHKNTPEVAYQNTRQDFSRFKKEIYAARDRYLTLWRQQEPSA